MYGGSNNLIPCFWCSAGVCLLPVAGSTSAFIAYLLNSNSSSYEHNYNGLINYLSSLSYFDNDLNKNVCFIDNDGIYQFNSDGESVYCFNLFVVSDSVNYVCFGHEGLPGMVVSGPFDYVRSDRLWDVHVVVSDSVIETNDDLTVSKRLTDYGIHHNNENVE